MRVLGFAYYNIYNTNNDQEVFDLRVLGFAHINIFISINDKETFDLRVLGRGRAEQIAILCNFKLFNEILYHFI